MKELLQIVIALFSGGALIAAAAGFVRLGRALERLDAHEQRIDRLESAVFPLEFRKGYHK